jgi:hypothetical protein
MTMEKPASQEYYPEGELIMIKYHTDYPDNKLTEESRMRDTFKLYFELKK